jgi:predicted TIM-barrel fold metal-dependent hydrolase
MNATTTAAAKALSGICDCHAHVFESETAYPFDPARTYTPAPAALDDLLALHRRLGVERMVLVQPSPYGTDNSCLLDALGKLGNAGRGVVVIDDDIPDAELRRMHEIGVRGVRVNLETAGEVDPAVAQASLQRMAERVAHLGWHVQTFTNLRIFKALAHSIPQLPVPLVVDHFGHARAEMGVDQPGFAELLAAVESGAVYVKLSAPYRVSKMAGYEDVAPLARALFQANPDRMLWASDWPHCGTAAGPRRAPSEITPFRDEDNARSLERCLEWARTPERARKVLAENPARLYDF